MSIDLIQNGAPEEIRTPSLLIRSQMLYPVELRARKSMKARKLAKMRQKSKVFIHSHFFYGFYSIFGRQAVVVHHKKSFHVSPPPISRYSSTERVR